MEGNYYLCIDSAIIIWDKRTTTMIRTNSLPIDRFMIIAMPDAERLGVDIQCVMGTDGCGLYGTDSLDEQIALTNFLRISDEEFGKMKMVEDTIIGRQFYNYINKMFFCQWLFYDF